MLVVSIITTISMLTRDEDTTTQGIGMRGRARRSLLGPKFSDRRTIEARSGQAAWENPRFRGSRATREIARMIARIQARKRTLPRLCGWPSGISWNGWDGQQNEYPSMTDERDCYWIKCVSSVRVPGVFLRQIPEFARTRRSQVQV